MKRKITIALIALASSVMSMTYASGYGTLVFKSATGESYYVETQGLEIYFNDGVVTFNNDSSSIPLATLVSMEFSNNSGIEGISADATGSVTVYRVDGIKAGEFASLAEAYENLKPGMYVVRCSNGKTLKINV